MPTSVSSSKRNTPEDFDSPTVRAQPRRTQRAPLSCTACTSRKAKCSQTVPCVQCLSRGRGSECRRETVLVKGETIRTGDQPGQTLASLEDLLAENATLRQRIEIVERELRLAKLSQPRPVVVKQVQGHSTADHEHEYNDMERMATVLNLLELGTERRGDPKALPLASAEHEPPSCLLSALPIGGFPALDPSIFPDADLSLKLVTFTVDTLGWLHATSHGPSFLQQHRLFQQQRTTMGVGCMGWNWLAFYSSQLMLAAHYVKPSVASSWNMDDPRSLASTWFKTTLQLLMAADFMGTANILSCHTMCNVGAVLHAYGPRLLGSSLMASAIRIAQALRVDHVPPESPCEPNRAEGQACEAHSVVAPHLCGSAGLLEREAHRRVWWMLIYRDWSSFPSGFPYNLPAIHLRVAHPLNLFDYQLSITGPMVACPFQQPTDASLHIARMRITATIHDFLIAYRQLDRNDPLRHQLTFDTDIKLAELFDDMPFFQTTPASLATMGSMGTELWLPSARYLVMTLVAHKRLLLHRDYFALSYTNADYLQSRAECVARAREIAQLRSDRPENVVIMEEDVTPLLAAATVLALNIAYSPPRVMISPDEVDSGREEASNLLALLQTEGSFERHSKRIAEQIRTLLEAVGCAARATQEPTKNGASNHRPDSTSPEFDFTLHTAFNEWDDHAQANEINGILDGLLDMDPIDFSAWWN